MPTEETPPVPQGDLQLEIAYPLLSFHDDDHFERIVSSLARATKKQN